MRYEIHVEGALGERWSNWFHGLDVTTRSDGVTVISGAVQDQAELHGILTQIRDLGIVLITVQRIEP